MTVGSELNQILMSHRDDEIDRTDSMAQLQVQTQSDMTKADINFTISDEM